jgi:hypothetical protein
MPSRSPHLFAALAGAGLALASLALFLPVTARAAETKSQVTMLVNERGSVEVVDRWTGLKQTEGTFQYFSAAREVGTIPVKVVDGGFTISFRTRSYLRYEEGLYFFVTPDFYYEGGPLDVDLSLTFPPNLSLVEANPKPEYQGDGVLHWSLKDVSHQVIIAKFDRTGPFVDPQRSGPDYQVDPRLLEILSQEELPHSADETLKELENIIKVAGASGSTDPEFVRVLEKLLAKLYYVMDSNGLLLDYAPPGIEKKAVAEQMPEEESPEPEPTKDEQAKPKHKPKAAAGP